MKDADKKCKELGADALECVNGGTRLPETTPVTRPIKRPKPIKAGGSLIPEEKIGQDLPVTDIDN